MTDTAHDELVALTAEAEAMSQRYEDEERVWQGIHTNDGVPAAQKEGAEQARRAQLPLADLLREATATSTTRLAHAEQT